MRIREYGSKDGYFLTVQDQSMKTVIVEFKSRIGEYIEYAVDWATFNLLMTDPDVLHICNGESGELLK